MKRLLVLVLLLAILCPVAHASLVTEWTMQLYPAQGTTTGDILILIRNITPTGSTPLYVYVFYDDVCLIQKQAAPSTSGVYTYQLDLKIKPPATTAATVYGYHQVTVRIEDNLGTSNSKSLSYKIVDGIPQGEWWKNLPTGYYEYLKGAKGDTGATGAQGPQGETGPAGTNGVSPTIDYGYLVNSIDFNKLWNSMPDSVMKVLKGATGEQGPEGKDADPFLTYAAILLAITAITIEVWRIRKNV